GGDGLKDLSQTTDMVEVGVGHDYPFYIGRLNSCFGESAHLISALAHESGINQGKVAGLGLADQIDVGIRYHFILAGYEKKRVGNFTHVIHLLKKARRLSPDWTIALKLIYPRSIFKLFCLTSRLSVL